MRASFFRFDFRSDKKSEKKKKRVLLDRAVVIADVPPVLDHRDDERPCEEHSQNGDVLVTAFLRVLLGLESADSEVRLQREEEKQ